MPLNLRRRFTDVSRCGDADATESPKAIRFFHPGYGKAPISSDAQPPIRDALISFPAFDDGGIVYDIAHTACGILAGNRWDGYGKATSFSTEAVNSLTNVISLRTDVHRMFDERNFCFAPKTDEYQREVLPLRTREGDGIASTNISVNEVQLPSTDQHDSGKASRTEPSSSDTSPAPVVLAAHVFNSIPGGELQKLFHNREAHPAIYAASLECLFARFAWTIFSPNIFRDFLFMTKEPRVLLVWDEELGQYRTERAEKSKCIMTAQEARARSKSPTKRQRSTGETGQVDQEYLYGEDEFDESDHFRDQYADDSSAIDSGFHDEVFDNDTYDSPERGRSRKRKFSEPYWPDGGNEDATEVQRTNRSVL
ncbi:hypothetical protein Forpi1262_v015327 [Fusarium oxysporum f. sp. raphani]|uniref:HNH nuclease domain-containing protein n=1 Tax=Fusarium oxysporum f. sp. raphani TaxID=96318 RepID=A0A8J5PKI6_FUSOX|nr:hypothetical protein Forpi1262_v015327 [Fusarium oxysporum f. sp. raphani]